MVEVKESAVSPSSSLLFTASSGFPAPPNPSHPVTEEVKEALASVSCRSSFSSPSAKLPGSSSLARPNHPVTEEPSQELEADPPCSFGAAGASCASSGVSAAASPAFMFLSSPADVPSAACADTGDSGEGSADVEGLSAFVSASVYGVVWEVSDSWFWIF